MHPALSHVAHRPWPLPRGPWLMRQSWRDLLFAHWPVPAAHLRALVPEPLTIDEHGGTSWVGLVPFRMTGVMVRGLPDLPGLSAFPELNLRLYVTLDGKPGVWFVSLDAANAPAVWGARRFFHLPYFRAAMECRAETDAAHAPIHYLSERRVAGGGPRVTFAGSYAPTSEVFASRPGTLAHFLTERYCLYAARPDGGLLRAEVHHAPWPLQTATLGIVENTVGAAQGIALDGPPPVLHFARRLDVVVWRPRRV